MPQTPSATSSIRSCGSTPLESIAEDVSTTDLSLPAPALAFASASSHMHSSIHAPKKASPTSSPTSQQKNKKQQQQQQQQQAGAKTNKLSDEDRIAMLMQFVSERDDDGATGLPPRKKRESADKGSTDKRRLFKSRSGSGKLG